jgi:23S rRNA (cytidine2498-2'-O)-methyltransferase
MLSLHEVMHRNALTCLLLYCRPGFEKECATEIMERAAELGVSGYAKAKPDSAYVVFAPHDAGGMSALADGLRLDRLVFARQLICSSGLVSGLPVAHRTVPLLEAARALGTRFGALLLETADTNEAKETLAFCRKFEPHMRRTLEEAGLLGEGMAEAPRLHLFFLGSAAAYVGLSFPCNSSPWPMGIPRLKMPREAPSRSTLKLVEAMFTLLDDEEREERLKPGMKAVDLGAAPGGWSWQLAQRGLLVTAVDNGTLDKQLLASGMVEHLHEDGFHFRPGKPVDWMVCDMVESPSRIAALVAEWVATGLCRDCIFNLKLPMKKRHEEVERCRAIIEQRIEQEDLRFELRLKQLYHDREEVTGYLHAEKQNHPRRRGV